MTFHIYIHLSHLVSSKTEVEENGKTLASLTLLEYTTLIHKTVIF